MGLYVVVALVNSASMPACREVVRCRSTATS